MNPGFGRGFGGWDRGGGRGWGNWLWAAGLTSLGYAFSRPRWGALQAFATPSRDQELGDLKAQARNFESALADIRKRIEELEPKSKQE
jgi:hypothetical protein